MERLARRLSAGFLVSLLAAGGCILAGLPPRAPLESPFCLTPDQEAELDRILQACQEKYGEVRSLTCRFDRWAYDAVFRQSPEIDSGELRLLASGKVAYSIEGPRPERWVWSDNRVYEFNYAARQVIQHEIPPGTPFEKIYRPILLADLGVLIPASTAVKEKYYLRLITPPSADGQIWIEIRPRFTDQAALWDTARLILNRADLLPFALEVTSSGGKRRTVYRFDDVALNDPSLDAPDVFDPASPDGWRKVIDAVPSRMRSD